jgi:mannan endo-1,4-beta-mannosidase
MAFKLIWYYWAEIINKHKPLTMKTLILYFSFTLLIAINTNQLYSVGNTNSIERDHATENLYTNLKRIASEGKVMFGCANPTTLMYKETHIFEGFENSDIKEITGQNPAVYESDFMWYDDPKLIAPYKEASRKAYERGAVIAYCWHLRGKESKSFYSKNKDSFTADKDLVKKIVDGGERAENPYLNWLYTKLDTMVISTFKEFGFPVIFRPWHEMNGGWFWWGKDNCTPDEFIELFKITVDYMRKSGLTNVLYAWSPDTKLTMEYYPGDDYVDILGLDIYEMAVFPHKSKELIVSEIEKMTDYAEATNKVAAITETGLRIENGIYYYPEIHPDFWSKYVLQTILATPKTNRVVWVLSWYSSDWGRERKSQFYYPYKGIENDYPKGQVAIDDFMMFFKHEATLFEDDLPDMYK